MTTVSERKKKSHKFSVLRIWVNLRSSCWLTLFKLRPSDHQWRSRLKGRTARVGHTGANQECFFWDWSCATWPTRKETVVHAHTHTEHANTPGTSYSSTGEHTGGNTEVGPWFRTRKGETHTNIQNWADSFSNIREENRKVEITLCWQTLISFLGWFVFFFWVTKQKVKANFPKYCKIYCISIAAFRMTYNCHYRLLVHKKHLQQIFVNWHQSTYSY